MPCFNTDIFTRQEPCIVEETKNWAVVYKPPHLPTAPLRENEEHTLVHWFLSGQDAEARAVHGKKAIEAGLLHRLDTETRGLVLFAKTQACYDFLQEAQNKETITKEYYAFTVPQSEDAVRQLKAVNRVPTPCPIRLSAAASAADTAIRCAPTLNRLDFPLPVIRSTVRLSLPYPICRCSSMQSVCGFRFPKIRLVIHSLRFRRQIK